MWAHRICGIVLALLGLAVLFGQLAVLYGLVGDPDMMVRIGLAGSAILTSAGAVSFAAGCLLAAAPHATMLHAGRIAGGGRRR